VNRTISPQYIALPPFNPRLLVPLSSPCVHARSFELYSPGSVRGKLLKWCGVAVARIGLMNLAGRFLAAPVNVFTATEEIRPILEEKALADLQGDWKQSLGKKEIFCTISLGEPTPYRKITALVFGREGESLAVAKAGCTPQAAALIANERAALETVGPMETSGAVIPTLLGHGETGPVSWILETPLLSGRPSPAVLQREHIDFLAAMARSTTQMMPLQRSALWQRLQDVLRESVLPITSGFEAERQFVAELVRRFPSMCPENAAEDWPFTVTHGDFTPWNMRLGGGKLALFDWEYFLPAAPAGWDLLYFIVRVENLIRKKSLERIWGGLEAGAYGGHIALWEERSGLRVPDWRILASFIVMAIAFDSLPGWICEDKSLYSDELT